MGGLAEAAGGDCPVNGGRLCLSGRQLLDELVAVLSIYPGGVQSVPQLHLPGGALRGCVVYLSRWHPVSPAAPLPWRSADWLRRWFPKCAKNKGVHLQHDGAQSQSRQKKERVVESGTMKVLKSGSSRHADSKGLPCRSHLSQRKCVWRTVCQGTHTSMKSGMLAAEAAFEALMASDARTDAHAASTASPALDLSEYETRLKASWVWEELQRERNIRPAFSKLGLYGGIG
jgi:hypothetical protein